MDQRPPGVQELMDRSGWDHPDLSMDKALEAGMARVGEAERIAAAFATAFGSVDGQLVLQVLIASYVMPRHNPGEAEYRLAQADVVKDIMAQIEVGKKL